MMAVRAKKRLRVVWLLVFFLITSSTNANAATSYDVVTKSSNIHSYISSISNMSDYLMILFADNTVKKYKLTIYDASFSSVVYESPLKTADTYYSRIDLKCTGGFVMQLYDTSNTNANIKLTVSSADHACKESDFSSLGENQHKEDTTSPSDTGGTGSTGSTGSTTETCDMCATFECPEWDKYMSKVDDIIDKIPDPPNWEKVIGSTKAKDVPKIDVPQMPQDAVQVEEEDKPKMPSIFDVLDSVDDKNATKPTQEKSPKIDDLESLDDVKAPKEKADTTGGFKITNPVDQMDDGSNAPKPKTEELPTPSKGNDELPTPTTSQEIKTPTTSQEIKTPTTSQEIKTPTTSQEIKTPTTSKDLQVPMPSNK